VSKNPSELGQLGLEQPHRKERVLLQGLVLQLLGCSAASHKQSGQALLSLQLSEALRDELAVFETCFTKSPWFGMVHCHSENKIALLGRIPPISDTPTILLIICQYPINSSFSPSK
jgi:hypothetical protein